MSAASSRARVAETPADWPGPPVDAALRQRPDRLVHRGHWAALEPLNAAHAEALWPLARNCPESWTWLPAGPFLSEPSFRGFVRMAAASSEELVWAVCPHDEAGRPGPAAGWLALLDIRPAHATVELGNIWFPPGLAGTRAATEAYFLLLDHVLGALSYLRVGWKCNALHTGSRRAAERLGFQYEGTLRAHMIARGRRRDTAWYGLVAEEWAQRSAKFRIWLDPSNFDPGGRQLTKL